MPWTNSNDNDDYSVNFEISDFTFSNDSTFSLSEEARERVLEQVRNSRAISNEVPEDRYTGESTMSGGDYIREPDESSRTEPNSYDRIRWLERGIAGRLRKKYVHGPKMTEIETARWFYEQYQRITNRGEAINAYNGEIHESNGYDAIIEGVCANASDELEQEYDRNGGNPVAAFNTASTSGWPNLARAYLAQYELLNDNTFDDDDYREDLEEFVEVCDIDTTWEPSESELDYEYPRDPRASELSSNQVDVLMVLRCTGENLSDIDVEEIRNPHEFFDVYEDTDDIQIATHYQRFDSHLNRSALEGLAPPDEWPDNLIPGSLERYNCQSCGTSLYKVFTEDREVEHIDSNGNHHDVYTDDVMELHPENGVIDINAVCGQCVGDANELSGEGRSRTVVMNAGYDTVVAVGMVRGAVVYDHSNNHEDLSSLSEVNDEDIGLLHKLLLRSTGDDVITMNPGDGPSSRTATHPVMRQLIESPADVPVGVAIMRYSDLGESGYTVSFPADSVSAARAAKELLEEPQAVIA